MKVKLKIFTFSFPYKAIFGFVREVKVKTKNNILILPPLK